MTKSFWASALALVLVVVGSLVGWLPEDPMLTVLLVGAVATYTPSTSETDLSTVWKIAYTPLADAIRFATDEWDMLDDVQNANVNPSARTINMPLNLDDEVGAAWIPEGGYEARPSSVKPVEATVDWTFLNLRFSASRTAEILNQTARARAAAHLQQLMYQGRQKIHAAQRKVADAFYGFSDGVAALVNGAPSSNVFTLDSMYGRASRGGLGTSRVVTDLFRVNEYVMVAELGGSTFRGVAKITAVTPATPSITLDSTPGSSADNDEILFANSLENGTNASSCDHNKALVGLLDICTSTSVHSVSSATYANWDVAHSDTTSGRFTADKLRRGLQKIRQLSPYEADTVIWSSGVANDTTAFLRAAQRFNDNASFRMDGDPTHPGIKFMDTKFVPDSCCFAFSKKALRKFMLVPKPDQGPGWGDGHKLVDQSGYVFSVDVPMGLITNARRAFAFWENQTEIV